MTRLLNWRSVANLTLQVALLTLLIAAFFVPMRQVSGLSMAPHIAPGEYVLVNTFAYRFGKPKRGDIVAFAHDGDSRTMFIKRVVGLPGDRIVVDRGNVFVNGTELSEPYVRYADDRSFPQLVVPNGSVYVLGDNRAESEDSRFFGPVTEDRLMGRAIAGVWPPSDLGVL